MVNAFEAGIFLFSTDYRTLGSGMSLSIFEDMVVIAKWEVWFPSQGDKIVVVAGHVARMSKIRTCTELYSEKGLQPVGVTQICVRLNKNTDVMQQDADFITAEFLYMFRGA